MNQFEEQWKKYEEEVTKEGLTVFHPRKVIAGKFWRKALEWVKREAVSLDGRGNISKRTINKELKQ